MKYSRSPVDTSEAGAKRCCVRTLAVPRCLAHRRPNRAKTVARLLVFSLASLLLGACMHDTTHTSQTGKPPTASRGVPYSRYCNEEGGVCRPGTEGIIPAVLSRPLRFPALSQGDPCPVSRGTAVNNPDFGGIALGKGPVRPILAEEPTSSARRGLAVLITHTSAPGWDGFKTLWFSDRSYQGPFIIRAKRIDKPGKIVMGERPSATMLVVPPGPTINGGGGRRAAPGGTWVKSPGCYAWQVDGLSFSTVIVTKAVLPGK